MCLVSKELYAEIFPKLSEASDKASEFVDKLSDTEVEEIYKLIAVNSTLTGTSSKRDYLYAVKVMKLSNPTLAAPIPARDLDFEALCETYRK